MEQVAKQQNYYLSFFSRRLHSLLGVIPVGVFLISHLFTNYKATSGMTAFVEQVKWIHNLPFLTALEFLLIFFPLLYHGGYGLYVAFTAKHNLNQYGTFRNMLFFLQRVTGVITLVFILWHLWETKIYVEWHHLKPEDMAPLMVRILSGFWMFWFYVVGIVAATFHFCNGMWSFLVTWGVTVGPRAQRVSTGVWILAFAVLAYMGIKALLAFKATNFLQI